MKDCLNKIKYLLTKHKWLAYLIFFILIFSVYGRSLSFNYSYLDDQRLLLENSDILVRANFEEIFTNDVFFGNADKFYYRPLLTYSFVLDWHLSGANVHFSHFTNIIYHFLAVSLLFIVLGLAKISRDKAFYLSLIFALHPALTPAVAWIPGRNDSLLAIFTFIFLILLSRFLRQEKLWQLVLLGLSFLAALFVKESAILIAPLALFWAYIYQRENLNRFKILLTGAVLFVSAFIWYLARSLVVTNIPLSETIILLFSKLAVPLVYLGKVFFPVNFSVYAVPADIVWWPGSLVIVILIIILAYHRGRNAIVTIFGLLWFWLFLIFAAIRPDGASGDNFMDHRLYLAIFGLLLIISRWKFDNLSIKLKKFLPAAYLCLLILFITLSYRYSLDFRNPISFWERVAANSPHSALAQRNLGAMYYLDNRLVEAEVSSLKALELHQEELMVNNNLAAIYIDWQDYGKAKYYLQQELELNPNYDLAWYNLARVYYLEGDYQRAEKLWLKVLELNPRNFQATHRLEELYELKKE